MDDGAFRSNAVILLPENKIKEQKGHGKMLRKIFHSLTDNYQSKIWNTEKAVRSKSLSHKNGTNREVKILVMMSTYNGEKYLEPQILSIMNQKVNATVFLRIKDDGSTDRTCQIIERLQEIYPNKIELLRGQNKGYNASFFELLHLAYGFDYYAISDQDDVWIGNKLQSGIDAIEALHSNKPLLFASTSYLVKDDLVPYGTTQKKERELTIHNTAIQNICPGHNMIFNETLAALIRSTDVDVSRIDVYDSWIMNYAMLYGEILFSNVPLTYYRQHNDNQIGCRMGKDKIGRLTEIKKGIWKNKHQLVYFIELNRSELERIGAYDELKKYVSEKKLSDRVIYALHSKLYKQDLVATIALKFAIALGKI